MRGIDWLFLVLAVISAGLAVTCAYYARNCSANTDLVIRAMVRMVKEGKPDALDV